MLKKHTAYVHLSSFSAKKNFIASKTRVKACIKEIQHIIYEARLNPNIHKVIIGSHLLSPKIIEAILKNEDRSSYFIEQGRSTFFEKLAISFTFLVLHQKRIVVRDIKYKLTINL